MGSSDAGALSTVTVTLVVGVGIILEVFVGRSLELGICRGRFSGRSRVYAIFAARVWVRVGTGRAGQGHGFFLLAFCIPVSYTHLTLPTNREV